VTLDKTPPKTDKRYQGRKGPLKRKPRPEWMRVFARNLRNTRRRLKISQAELAERCGLHPQGISNIECGNRRGINFTTAKRLAIGLGVTLDSLMDGKKPKPRPGKARKIPKIEPNEEELNTWPGTF